MSAVKSKLASVIAVLVAAVVVAPLLVKSAIEVTQGRGGEQYHNVYGLGIAWSSLLIFAAVFLAAFLITLVARVIYFWRAKRGL